MEQVAAIMDVGPLRREQILNALYRLIARVGWEKATVQAIAAEAEVARGSLHYYFGQKEDMLRSLVRVVCIGEKERWARMVLPKAPPEEQLRSAIHVLLRTGDPLRRDFARNWSTYALFATRDDKLRRFLDDYEQVMIDALAQVLAAGVKKKLFRPLDPQATAITVFGMVEGSLLQWASDARSPAMDKGTEIVEEMVLSYVLGRVPSRVSSRG